MIEGLKFTQESVKEDAKKVSAEISKLSAQLTAARAMLTALYTICGHKNARHAHSRMDCPDCGYGDYYGDR